MLLVQFSAAKGPDECALAVAKALSRFLQEAASQQVSADVLEQEQGKLKGTLLSALVSIEGDNSQRLINRWQGTVQWICPSPYRPHHKRKNWFIGVNALQLAVPISDGEIRFETTKSSGAGGQHVNKTESAVRATHVATGITVKVQSERSQHANKRLAKLWLDHKIAELNSQQSQQQKAKLHQQHQQLARGKAGLTFYGEKFIEQ